MYMYVQCPSAWYAQKSGSGNDKETSFKLLQEELAKLSEPDKKEESNREFMLKVRCPYAQYSVQYYMCRYNIAAVCVQVLDN